MIWCEVNKSGSMKCVDARFWVSYIGALESLNHICSASQSFPPQNTPHFPFHDILFDITLLIVWLSQLVRICENITYWVLAGTTILHLIQVAQNSIKGNFSLILYALGLPLQLVLQGARQVFWKAELLFGSCANRYHRKTHCDAQMQLRNDHHELQDEVYFNLTRLSPWSRHRGSRKLYRRNFRVVVIQY